MSTNAKLVALVAVSHHQPQREPPLPRPFDDVLDKYIRTCVCDDVMVKEKIDALHQANLFKLHMPDAFDLD